VRCRIWRFLREARISRALLFVLILGLLTSRAQVSPGHLQVMFYNVENFFDPFDDTLTRDDEFTPEGEKNWSYAKFIDKAVKISRVIIACGEDKPPSIVGLAEIENRFVLEKLVYETPLNSLRYGIVHKDSPDWRGIDVALIYRKEEVVIDTFYYLPVVLGNEDSKTRDILIVQSIVFEADTLLIAVNHWPSRYGGAATSSSKRMIASSTLKAHLDSISMERHELNIIIMGDFNDEPSDPSLKAIIEKDIMGRNGQTARLNNLMTGISKDKGTAKYNGHWHMFDQLIVSENLLMEESGLCVKNKKAAILAAAFLLEADNSHLGEKPFRTFNGPAFHNGYSDHLPVYLILYKL
jgi:predicted extracellular nuclease